jgi:triacylglycerol esterase/lipase EstA (alpha/beta hydrolase family)
MDHFMTPLETEEDTQSLGYFSVDPPKTLFLFVHGWGGNPQETWFPLSRFLIKGASAGAAPFDAIFYAYDSRRQNTATSIEVLARFVRDYLADPIAALSRSSNGVIARPPGSVRYSRINICSHSLGAVVSRGALVRLIDDANGDPGWGAEVRQVLFAPAHKGAKVQAVLETFANLHQTGKFLIALSRLFSPAYDELKEENIVWLEKATLEKLKEYPALAPLLKARTVFWAKDDKIVVNKPFGKDPLASIKDGESHTSICKPNDPQHEVYREFIAAV